jgi:phage terminase large subunit-like protein
VSVLQSELTPLEEVLTRWPARLLATTEGRRIATRLDPQLFCAIYMRHHLSNEETGHQVSYADCHLDWYEQMKEWVKPRTAPREWRKAFIAPRNAAKSTHWFLFAPLWAGAHGHVRFIAAFGDAGGAAETHLANFRAELDNNELLRKDFPELCTTMRRKSGRNVSDNAGMYQAKSGFIFAARSIDSSNLGLKIEQYRPDVLIMDDIEKGEANYSTHQIEQRLSTVQNVILPLNERARVVLVGTVTMSGSIVHQLNQPVQPAWVKDQRFETHYYPAIVTEPDGSERSLWPQLWPMEYLSKIRHTRDFAMQFMNKPVPADSPYWTSIDFTYGQLNAVTRVVLSIDPAVTTKRTSDRTALAVVGFSPSENKCEVRYAKGVRLRGNELRESVLNLLVEYPDIKRVLCETNQGGDLWMEVLHDLPVPVYAVTQSVKKEVRAARTLNHYQHGRVLHTEPLHELQQEQIEFPRGQHDDLVDAVGTAVDYLLKPPAQGARSRAASYV